MNVMANQVDFSEWTKLDSKLVKDLSAFTEKYKSSRSTAGMVTKSEAATNAENLTHFEKAVHSLMKLAKVNI